MCNSAIAIIVRIGIQKKRTTTCQHLNSFIKSYTNAFKKKTILKRILLQTTYFSKNFVLSVLRSLPFPGIDFHNFLKWLIPKKFIMYSPLSYLLVPHLLIESLASIGRVWLIFIFDCSSIHLYTMQYCLDLIPREDVVRSVVNAKEG